MSKNQASKAHTAGTPASWELDRRTFLGTVGLTAGAVIAASVAPLAAQAAAGGSGTDDAAAHPVDAQPAIAGPAEELWDIDDMWGHRPRYAHPIPYAHGIPGAGPLESSGPYSVIAREP